MDIKRDKYLVDLINRMNNGMIKVVTGIRRCGKSYLIFTIFKNYLKEQGIDESHIVTIELDQRKDKKYRDPDVILEYIESRIIDDKKFYILLDEVQLLIALSLNAISRLWWYGHLTYDGDNPANPYHLTELLTSNTDLCQNLIQHKYSMNKNVTLGFLDAVERFINEGNDFTEDIERQTIKFVNRYGGVVVIDVLSRTEISTLVYEYIKKKSKYCVE